MAQVRPAIPPSILSPSSLAAIQLGSEACCLFEENVLNGANLFGLKVRLSLAKRLCAQQDGDPLSRWQQVIRHIRRISVRISSECTPS